MEALAALKELSKDKVVKLKDAAAVTKTPKGKIKLHQTKDDKAGKGFVKGGLVGILFAAVLGPPGWIVAGAALGTAFASFDRGIKNKLLKELGENMTPSESAVAVLVEDADWPTAIARMQAHNFEGEIVVQQLVGEDMVEVEKLLEDAKTVAAVPEEMEVPAPVAEPPAPVPPEEPEMVRTKALVYMQGVGEAYSQKLKDAGIANVEQLREKGATPKGREEIAKATGVSEKIVQRWVTMADLYRVKGIGKEYAELLEATGIDSVPELAQRSPGKLLGKMAVANEQKKMVRRMPVLSQVESWVGQAKSLPRIITF
jgi:uncharacterized membrane protein